MYVATYGRGLWKFEFVCDGSLSGLACSDLDPCTTNDIFDGNCNCSGTLADSDGDGVCDGLDVCDGGDDAIDGDNDGVPNFCDGCATDCPDADCDSVCDADDICANGDDTRDMDGDGIPDYCDPCDDIIGTPCNDGNACTSNDIYDSDCNCVGTFIDTDNDGVCDSDDLCPGSDDTADADGDTIPDACDNCDHTVSEGVNLIIRLDDYPEETSWDLKDIDGTVVASGGTYGSIPDGSIVIEELCDLDNGCFDFTIYDAYGDGICCNYGTGYYILRNSSGETLATGGDFAASDITSFCIQEEDCSSLGGDSDGDGVCDANDQCPGLNDALIGTSCDDDNDCTINDVWGMDCNCTGTISDSDNDGVCDADDQCPGLNDALIGTSCDDGNDCSVNDVWGMDCNCTGTITDSDNDGVCDADDLCPGIDDAIIGTSCDDGDVCTTNDVYDSNCNCLGTLADSDNDGVCDANDQCPLLNNALIGTSCDDGDECSTGDVWGTDCNCAGIISDTDGDGVCDQNDICEGGDDTIDTDNDGIPDFCDSDTCVPKTSSFINNPLTHTGSGSNSTTINYTTANQDISFTISNINQRTNGPSNRRYIERVTVSYVDINGNTQIEGIYTGDNVNTQPIYISEPILSLTVSIEDAIDGNSGRSEMSISFTSITRRPL